MTSGPVAQCRIEEVYDLSTWTPCHGERKFLSEEIPFRVYNSVAGEQWAPYSQDLSRVGRARPVFSIEESTAGGAAAEW